MDVDRKVHAFLIFFNNMFFREDVRTLKLGCSDLALLCECGKS